MTNKRNQYTREFKLEAISLVVDHNRKIPDVADSLGMAHKIHANILDRNFSPSMPNQVWTGDVTYVRIKSGWCYLAVVLDLFAQRVVCFSVSDSPNSMLTAKALQMAYQTRLKPSSVLFHSDQGTHYTSKTFAESVVSCDGML